MRIALVTEATYPYLRSGVAAWCHRLCAGLPWHAFEVITVTGGAATRPAYRPPANVIAVRPVPVTGRPAPAAPRQLRRLNRRWAAVAAAVLCRGLLDDGPTAAGMFRDGLRQLADLAADGHPLHGVPLAEIVADAWRATGHGLPPLSLRDAEAVAGLLDHALRPLAAPTSGADVTHAVGAGLPLLVALAAKWRHGIPYLVTEHGNYLRDRYRDAAAGPPGGARTATLRFFRALARLGYTEAAAVAPISRYHRRWPLRLGARAEALVVIPPGVDPLACPPLPEIDGPPTVGWVGRIGPDRAAHALVRMFALVVPRAPGARLRLCGPVAEGGEEAARELRELVDGLGLAGAATIVGPVRTPLEAHARSHVAALPGDGGGGAIYPAIEAMMCGRAAVATDAGAAAEVIGEAGVLVPAGDPAAFAHATAGLLTDPAARHRLAAAARRRAVDRYTVDAMLAAYDALYAALDRPFVPGAGPIVAGDPV